MYLYHLTHFPLQNKYINQVKHQQTFVCKKYLHEPQLNQVSLPFS